MEKGASLALKTLAAGADDDMIQGVQVLLIGDLAPTQIRAISVRWRGCSCQTRICRVGSYCVLSSLTSIIRATPAPTPPVHSDRPST